MTEITLNPTFDIGSISYYLRDHHYHTLGNPPCPYDWEDWKRIQSAGVHSPYKWTVVERICTSFTVSSKGITRYHFGPYGVLDGYLVGNPMTNIFFTRKEAEDAAFYRNYDIVRRMEGIPLKESKSE